jgi:hypothetical protein
MRFTDALEDIIASYTKMGFYFVAVCSPDHSLMSIAHRNKCNDPGKAAILKGWKGFRCSSRTQLDYWLKRFPSMNIGMLFGRASGYMGIDIDGFAGEKLLLEKSGGEVYKTWEFTTPGGGRRLMFKISRVGSQLNRVAIQPINGQGGISLLADNQQTVLPPSVHRNGGIYKWVREPWKFSCCNAPAWAIELMENSNDTDTYDGLD